MAQYEKQITNASFSPKKKRLLRLEKINAFTL
jgi:hypothetical protein